MGVIGIDFSYIDQMARYFAEHCELELSNLVFSEREAAAKLVTFEKHARRELLCFQSEVRIREGSPSETSTDKRIVWQRSELER